MGGCVSMCVGVVMVCIIGLDYGLEMRKRYTYSIMVTFYLFGFLLEILVAIMETISYFHILYICT